MEQKQAQNKEASGKKDSKGSPKDQLSPKEQCDAQEVKKVSDNRDSKRSVESAIDEAAAIMTLSENLAKRPASKLELETLIKKVFDFYPNDELGVFDTHAEEIRKHGLWSEEIDKVSAKKAACERE